MKNKYIIIIFIIVAPLLFYYFGGDNDSAPESDQEFSDQKSDAQSISTTNSDSTTNYEAVEFKSELYGFSLRYPKNLIIGKFDEGGGAQTITFEDKTAETGFQIFIVPYEEDLVSDERFYKDVPSGVRKNSKNLQIDNIQATSFNSSNLFLGETFEVWFINNGFLYEVTTVKKYESWLLEILKTWQFSEPKI